MAGGFYVPPHYAPAVTGIDHFEEDSAQDQFAGTPIAFSSYLQEVQGTNQRTVEQQAAAPAFKAPRAK
jgi:hypothetical protein